MPQAYRHNIHRVYETAESMAKVGRSISVVLAGTLEEGCQVGSDGIEPGEFDLVRSLPQVLHRHKPRMLRGHSTIAKPKVNPAPYTWGQQRELPAPHERSGGSIDPPRSHHPRGRGSSPRPHRRSGADRLLRPGIDDLCTHRRMAEPIPPIPRLRRRLPTGCSGARHGALATTPGPLLIQWIRSPGQHQVHPLLE